MAVCSSMNPNEGLLLLCIDLLLEHGANVNAVDKFGCSALHYAARFGRTLLTKSLCENGAIINHVNRNGWSVRYLLSQQQQQQTTKKNAKAFNALHCELNESIDNLIR